MQKKLKNTSKEVAEYMENNFPDIIVCGLADDATLYLETLGECSGCPYQCMSKESNLQQTLPQLFPNEIFRVSVSQHISADTLNLARRMLGLPVDA